MEYGQEVAELEELDSSNQSAQLSEAVSNAIQLRDIAYSLRHEIYNLENKLFGREESKTGGSSSEKSNIDKPSYPLIPELNYTQKEIYQILVKAQNVLITIQDRL
jgi:hypothetical protein